MGAVVGLLLLLLIGVSHGLETYCDGRKDGAQCYGPLGGTVVLQLMDSASEIFRYVWSRGSTQILIGRENEITSNVLSSRSVFTPSDGKFRINDLSKNDSGEYKLMINFDFQKSEERILYLSVQETDNLPLIGGVLAALLIFLIVGVAVMYFQKKKQNTKPEEEGDKEELTYADINFTQRPGRQVEQRADLEVEYGQVKFSK